MHAAKVTCTRRVQFCAGHRVARHESKCAHLHGHNYVAHLEAEAPSLDSCGRVIDFSILKARIGEWIERCWDHGFILAEDDFIGTSAVAGFVNENGAKQKIFFLPYNPTAENIARYLLEVVGPNLLGDTGVRLVRVVIEETENCKAEASL